MSDKNLITTSEENEMDDINIENTISDTEEVETMETEEVQTESEEVMTTEPKKWLLKLKVMKKIDQLLVK